MSSPTRTGQSGFTILELLVAVGVMLVVLAGVTEIMSNAMSSTTAAKATLDMNSHLRAAVDLVQRDMLQVGQGLPVGRRVGIPNGPGATPITRPGPAAADTCPGVTTFPVDATLAAVSVGPGLGPEIGGVCSDVITILAADNQFGPVALAAISANGDTAIVHNRDTLGNVVNISDDPDVRSDNLRPGDLLMIEKGGTSILMQVTAVAGNQVTFGTGAADPLGINQFDTNLDMLGTINQVKAQAPTDPDVPAVGGGGVQQAGPSQATRVRMVTYFIDTATDPLVPRLVRQIGGLPPNAVGLGVEAFAVSYDIADQVINPVDVRMDADDTAGTGACSPDPCSENQIRKVNVLLSMRSSDQRRGSFADRGRQTQNTLRTQVSLRSMAFVDLYP